MAFLAHKCKLSVKSFFPILDWLPNYQGKWIRGDVIAALTLWALLVPEPMAYAGDNALAQEGLVAAEPSYLDELERLA